MKFFKISAAVVFLCLGTSLPANEVEQKSRTQSISGEPLDLPMLGRLSGRYQIGVQKHIAITIPFGLQYVGASLPLRTLSGSSLPYYLADLGIGARFYLTDDVFQDSWFLEPVASVGYLYGPLPISSVFMVTPKITAGYNWFWGSGLMVSTGLGVQYNIFLTTAPLPAIFSLRFPLPLWEIAVGYSW